MDRGDKDQLQLLGIFHIIYGALAAIAGLLTLAYMCALGFAEAVDKDGSAFAGGVVVVVGVVICALFVVKGLVMAASGYGLMHHKWRALSQLGAGLACLNIPMGTALAVFTFIVLDRASVRALYAGRPLPTPPVPAPYRPPVKTPVVPRRDVPPTTRPDPMRFRVA
jgi:hypothetical protein